MIFQLALQGSTLISVFFLLIFLPLSLFATYVVSPHYKKKTLILISLLYFLLVVPQQFLVIVVLGLVGYVACYLLYKSERKIVKRVLCTLVILFCGVVWCYFGILCVKEPPIIVLGGMVLPLLVIDIVIQTYRGAWEEPPSLEDYLLYVFFFPRLYMGPVESFQSFLDEGIWLSYEPQQMRQGFGYFIQGALQFLLFGMKLSQLANNILGYSATEMTFVSSWIGVLSVGLGIYHTIAGFSNMAHGLGLLYGVHLPVLTEYPFEATSIMDFEGRFLGTLRQLFFRMFHLPMKGESSPFMEMGLSFLVGACLGLWLSFQWSFVLWGMLLATISLLEYFVYGEALQKLPMWMQHGYAIVLLLLSFGMIAVGRVGTQSSLFLKMLVSPGKATFINSKVAYLLSTNALILILSILFSFGIWRRFFTWLGTLFPRGMDVIATLCHGLFFLVLIGLLVS